MNFSEFLYKVHNEAQFKTSSNVMDRDIKVTIRNNESYSDVQILDFEIDAKGDICLIVDATDEEESA